MTVGPYAQPVDPTRVYNQLANAINALETQLAAVQSALQLFANDGTVLSNISGASATAVFNTLSLVFDHDLGSTNGDIPIRLAGAWTVTATPLSESLGGTGQTTLSAAIDHDFGNAQGDILYRNASAWTVLAPGTSGYFLQTLGASANPVYAPVSTTQFSQTQDVTVANTVTETNLSGTGVGTLTLPANALAAGTTLKFTAFGLHSATGNPTIRVRIYAGATVLLDTTAVTSGNSTNAIWDLRGLVTCYTTGNTGTVWAEGFYEETGGGTGKFEMANTAAITLDTTTSQTLKLTVQWGTAAAGNSISMTNFTVEVLTP